jgi:hypothetical protein
MAFDQSTRGRLQKLVNSCRSLLSEEFSIQLQQTYGLDPNTGDVTPMARLTHLDDRQRHTAEVLRQTLAHYLGADADDTDHRIAVLDRMVREQAFTVLNRLAALLMMEARGQLIESVSKGYQSRGYQLYSKIAGTALGETGQAYQVYLFSVFDELAQELPALFERYAANGLLFPRETLLRALLDELNHFEISQLWAEDETIGWIYQYFNDPDERKRMRDPKQGGSQAPRNSRELAVRNQFFTPRYVVEFLVDNTLGHLWFKATGGKTELRDRCQYLLVQPDEQTKASSKLRDPRTLKLLDPACGSMHFGLYAFDLFLEIYQEAWAWEQQNGPGSLDVSTQLLTDLKPLCQTYADQNEYWREVPRLIIENNIYGVDIDPRAAQIATLALWLRAQRAWHDANVKAKDRSRICVGNVIAAVAPPSERELRRQFAAKLDQRDAELFEKTLQILKSLPDLGVLLRVEREVPKLIRQIYGGKGTGLFAEQEQESWRQAEARLGKGLVEFSQAANATYQGRLFSQDALEGLRLIHLVREHFDVVVMNPPFGAPTENTYEYIRSDYSGFHNDIYASFVARACELSPSGYVGCISSRSFLMSPRLEQFRSRVLLPKIISLADFGLGVMDDAHVEAAAYVLGPESNNNFSVIDIRKIPAEREDALKQAIREDSRVFLKREWFLALPQSKLLYAAPRRVRELLSSGAYFEPSVGTAREGMKSFDNFRFIRLWWEVRPSKIGRGLSWERFSKGGNFSYFYLDTHLVLNWAIDGAELKEVNRRLNGSTAQVRQASDYWYSPGVTYSKRSAKGFSARVLPADAIFTSNGPAVLSTSTVSSLYLLGWINSRLVRGFIHLQSNFGDYSTGSLKKLPWVAIGNEVVEKIERSSKSAVDASLLERASFHETSPWFAGPHLRESLFKTTVLLSKITGEKLKAHESAISLSTELLSKAYGISDLAWADELLSASEEVSDNDQQGIEDNASGSDEVSLEMVAVAFISYVVGCIFGRWDFHKHLSLLRSKVPYEIPNAFSSLPKCTPGQVDQESHLNGAQTLIRLYPNIVEVNGISESNTGARNRLIDRIKCLLDEFFDDSSSSWESELCSALGVSTLEEYIEKPAGFFSKHLAQYSLSGRQAPIYWPLATTSCSYTLWVYYPSLNNQTLFTAVNDFLDGPNGKLTKVSRECVELRVKGSGRSRDEQKQYEMLQSFEQELTDLRDTLLKIAPTYQPNHDDGVQITAAPLWPLFRQKPWQKVLKETWVKLEKGDYDWAHLAMTYWPERVREKCITDKSLATAHGLEDLYVEPDVTPKKTRAKKKVGSAE